MESIFAQHPNFMRSSRYPGKPTSLFKVAVDLGTAINPDYNVIGPGIRLVIDTEASTIRDYSPQKVTALKESIRLRLDRLKKQGFSQDKGKDIKSQFLDLLESSKAILAEKDGQRRRIQFLIDFIVASPFLYDSEGSPFSSVQDLDQLNGNQIDNLYRDLFAEHLQPLIFENAPEQHSGFIAQIRARYEKNFLESQLEPSLKLESQNATARQISLEEVPALVALFRGAFGHDCSMLSVPMYALHPKVRTFWIRESDHFNQQPQGYILAVEVNHNGRKRPLIITVNGPGLSERDARGAALALNSLYGNDQTILVSNKAALVNTEAMKNGLWYKEEFRFSWAKVTWPRGWKNVSEAWKTRREYGDYYAKDGLKENVIEVRLDSGELRQMQGVRHLRSDQVYREPTDLSQMPLFEKAMIASIFPPARQVLKLSRDVYASAKALAAYQAGEHDDTQIEHFYSWAQQLQMPLPDLLMSLNMDAKISAFSLFKAKDPHFFDSKEMKPVNESIRSYVNDRIARLDPKSSYAQNSVWDLVKRLGLQYELWPTVFLKAPWVALKQAGLRKVILSDIFTKELAYSPEGKKLFEQATKHLDRESVLIYYLRQLSLYDEWPDHIWRWAIKASSFPYMRHRCSPRGDGECDINEGIHQLNMFLVSQIRYKNPPYWLLSELVNALPKDYVWEDKYESYPDAFYLNRVAQLNAWLSKHKETITLEDWQMLAKVLEKAFVQTPQLLRTFNRSERLDANLAEMNRRFKNSKEVTRLRKLIEDSRICEKSLTN